MICLMCRYAGKSLADGYPSQAELEHSFCEGAGSPSWCDCQCKTTPGVVKRADPDE